MKRLKIKKGDKFGMLTVIVEANKYIQPSGQKVRAFHCKCECGKQTKVRLPHLTRGRIRSCGCLSGEKTGDTRNSKLYNKWRGIKNRCYNPNYHESHLYSKKGITMCEEWKNSYVAFRKWCYDNGWKHGLTIDRINGNKGYAPDNCRMVTPRANANNRINTFVVKYNDSEIPFTEILRQKDLLKHQAAIRARIKRGWSAQKAIDTPINEGNYFNTGYKYSN